MPDRLANAVDRLNRVPVPVTWDDVRARADGAELLATPISGSETRRHRRQVLVAAALLIACVATLALVTIDRHDRVPIVRTGPGPTTPAPSSSSPRDSGQSTSDRTPTSATLTTTASNPLQTATTLPAIGTHRGSAVTLWTGSEYLVWGGQAGSDAHQRADGWRYDPATMEVREVPIAPIGPRDSAAGVWTGEEMIVCCGRGVGGHDTTPGNAYDTATAAAFDPGTNRWRVLASPPPDAAGYVIGSVWTGAEMLVVVQTGDPRVALAGHGIALLAYRPDGDRWERRAQPPPGDRFGQATWTGDRLVMVTAEGAASAYDPAANAWARLPAFPGDHRPAWGSVAWVDGQIIAWGADAADDTAAVGYRLRPGERTWRPMAPAPIPPIDYYDGVFGSQTIMADPVRGRIVVLPVHGNERSGGGTGTEPPRLLAYHPSTDRWSALNTPAIAGYAPELTFGGGIVFTPDRAQPEVVRLTG